ncbi:MAG: hypothetical protein DI586_01835 [Micavibrio aeruginosavorus]|uniref:AsmA domain-containing protein n=1 Tax=Micavibrio aeruginosavorus TaxID=349221 RepID=A0A2W5FRD0_9BACT|nr:MAG: hypothetical protein DI586_01835 [Micavibrio aeruginosavorus]
MSTSRLSLATTWIIRILLFFIAILVAGLLMLSTLGGTSESHKKGLEQAFSDATNSNIKIQNIDEFNILPQLSIKATGLHGLSRTSPNEFMADRIDIAFGLSDLALGKRRIESFVLENFRFSADSKYDLKIESARIKPGEKALFLVDGQYKEEKIHFSAPLEQGSVGRSYYYFNDQIEIDGKYGELNIEGKVDTSNKAAPNRNTLNINILSGGRVVAKGQGGPGEGGFKINIDCKIDIPAKALTEIKTLLGVPFIELAETCE